MLRVVFVPFLIVQHLIFVHCLQIDIDVFQSSPPMLDVVRPRHLMPSAHQPQRNYHADQDTILEESTDSDANDRVTLAEIMKGKAGGAETSSHCVALDEEIVNSCPKGPRTTMHKRKASVVSRLDINHMMFTLLKMQLGYKCPSFLCSNSSRLPI